MPSGGGYKGALNIAKVAGGVALLSAAAYQSLYTVEGGHRAVIFNRLSGVSDEVKLEGTHIRVPWFQVPTIFPIRTKPTAIRSPTGTKDLQTVDITLRVLYRPNEKQLPKILSELGTNYAERVLPSIVNETLKAVVAQYNASQLITQRDHVSRQIKDMLKQRASEFMVEIDDVSITHLTFGKEYTAAIEAKQIAQQDAERAKYIVKQALQDKRSTIIKAQGEAESAKMIGTSIQKNPGFIELRQLDAARHISQSLAKSRNQVFLDNSTLLLDVNRTTDTVARLQAR